MINQYNRINEKITINQIIIVNQYNTTNEKITINYCKDKSKNMDKLL